MISYFISAALGMLLISCDNNDTIGNKHISGVYNGILTTYLTDKPVIENNSKFAAVIVTLQEDAIVVHCYNEDFETTIILNVYENGNNMMTCLLGEEFEKMYGHSLNFSNMEEYPISNNTQWEQHLEFEHKNGDQHIGYFNMLNNSFDYTFIVDGNKYHFSGQKEYIDGETYI